MRLNRQRKRRDAARLGVDVSGGSEIRDRDIRRIHVAAGSDIAIDCERTDDIDPSGGGESQRVIMTTRPDTTAVIEYPGGQVAADAETLCGNINGNRRADRALICAGGAVVDRENGVTQRRQITSDMECQVTAMRDCAATHIIDRRLHRTA